MWKPKLKKLELTKLVCVGFVVISQSTFAKDLQCKKDYESVISKNIVAISTALNIGDLQYIESKTDSSLIDYVGGKEAYYGVLALAANAFKKGNIVVSKVETQPPQDSYLVGNNEICFIPKQLTILINGKPQLGEKSFMLAVRPLASNEWKYLDGAGLKKNPDMLYTLFPDFSHDIKVPLID
jgi:hypothetical protein